MSDTAEIRERMYEHMRKSDITPESAAQRLCAVEISA